MKNIPVKNYFILLIMLFGVVVVTFAGKNYYNNNLKKVSDLYKYANHINRDELKEYLGESSSLIIYIADKYDLNNKDAEELLKDKIIELNLYNNFIYVDSRAFNDKFLDFFNNTYHTNLNMDNLPTIIIYDDGVVENIYYNLNIETINSINLEGVK